MTTSYDPRELRLSTGTGIIYFGCMGMRTPRATRPKQKRPAQEHDFSEDQDRCARCGMQRSVWEHTHALCPGKGYTIKDNRPLARCA